MKLIGAHVSAAGGVFNAPLNAKEIGATAYAMFTKNQKRMESNPLQKKEIDFFNFNMATAKINHSSVLVHDSYLINLGNPDPEKQLRSYQAFVDEIHRCEKLSLSLLNFHPGSHVGELTEKKCIEQIARHMNNAIAETENVILVIENTAGQGSNVGYKLEHLAHLIELVENKNRVGICLDTAHLFESGHPIHEEGGWEAYMEEFEKLVGISYLKGMHVNDSKTPFHSRVDRHASLGDGFIGLPLFKAMMKDPRLENIPLVLETPDPLRWADEIKLLRSFENGVQ